VSWEFGRTRRRLGSEIGVIGFGTDDILEGEPELSSQLAGEVIGRLPLRETG
jgi:hypothetical protein